MSCVGPSTPLVFTYQLVVQAVPSDFQRAISGGLRQDCSRSMALGVRRGEITLAARPSSGHWDRIWRRGRKRRYQYIQVRREQELSKSPSALSPRFLSVPPKTWCP